MQKHFGKAAILGAFAIAFALATVDTKTAAAPQMEPSPCASATPLSASPAGTAPSGSTVAQACPSPSASPGATMTTMPSMPSSGSSPSPMMTTKP